MLGDFNVHFDCPHKYDGAHVLTTLDASGLIQHVTQPTHKHAHTLDWFVTRMHEDGLLIDHDVDSNYISKTLSDHAIISCHLQLPRPELVINTSTFRNFRKIDNNSFASDIMDSLSNVNYKGDIEKFVSDFDNAIVSVLDTHVPLSSSSKPKRHKPNKWYNDLIDEARCDGDVQNANGVRLDQTLIGLPLMKQNKLFFPPAPALNPSFTGTL